MQKQRPTHVRNRVSYWEIFFLKSNKFFIKINERCTQNLPQSLQDQRIILEKRKANNLSHTTQTMRNSQKSPQHAQPPVEFHTSFEDTSMVE